MPQCNEPGISQLTLHAYACPSSGSQRVGENVEKLQLLIL
jgi:hypothetical protein